MRVGRTVAAFLALALAGGWTSESFAQERRGGKRRRASAADRAEERTKPTRATADHRSRKKVYRIKTEFVIEGRIQKPNAFYVLQRSAINYDWVDLKRHLLPHILKSVRESPF